MAPSKGCHSITLQGMHPNICSVTAPAWCFGQTHFGRVLCGGDLGVSLMQDFEELLLGLELMIT